MENRTYRPEDIRYYDSDSSSSSGFHGFDIGGADNPNRPPSPPPPSIRPNADELPVEELNITELSARIRRGHEERIAYWNARPSDPPLRRPMRAPGGIENYIDVDQVDFPERLVHDGAGLRDVGFRPQDTAAGHGPDAGEDDDDDEERALLREFRERLKIKKRERRRRYKESCRARGKSTSKKKGNQKSVAVEQPPEEDVPSLETLVDENWELEVVHEAVNMAAAEPVAMDVETAAAVEAIAPVGAPDAPSQPNPVAPVDVEMDAAAPLVENMDISENIRGSQQLLARHEAFMQELEDFYGNQGLNEGLDLYPEAPEVGGASGIPVSVLSNPFPALNEPEMTSADPRVVEGKVHLETEPAATITSTCTSANHEEEGLAGIVVGPSLADQQKSATVDSLVAADPAIVEARVEVSAGEGAGAESAGPPLAKLDANLLQMLPKHPLPPEQLTNVVVDFVSATLPTVPDETIPVVDLPNGLVFADEKEEEKKAAEATNAAVLPSNPETESTVTSATTDTLSSANSGSVVGLSSAAPSPPEQEEKNNNKEKEETIVAAAEVAEPEGQTDDPAPGLMDLDLPHGLPSPQIAPVVVIATVPPPESTPPPSPTPTPPGSPPPCVPVPPPAPDAAAEDPPLLPAPEPEIRADPLPVEQGNNRRAAERQGRPRQRERAVGRPDRPRQPFPRRPRAGDRRDYRDRPPPYPLLPTWGHINQEELLRVQGGGGRVGKLKTRRRRQSRARQRLREQGVGQEMLYFRYEWQNRHGRRRRV